MNIWIVWAQYYDHSNEPEFIEAFKTKEQADNLMRKLLKVSPSMGIYANEIWLENK